MNAEITLSRALHLRDMVRGLFDGPLMMRSTEGECRLVSSQSLRVAAKGADWGTVAGQVAAVCIARATGRCRWQLAA